MRLHFPRSFAARRPSAADRAATSERSIAELWLGAGHPLVRLLRRSETAFEQVVSVTAVQAAGVVFVFGGWAFGLWLAVAAAAVQVALGCRVAALRAHRRDLCLELIANGRAELPLACVERLCRRLVASRRGEQLASWIDQMVDAAAHPQRLALGPRPLADVRLIRAVGPELRQVASLLRGGDPCVRGVALVEWLLTSPATPLYGMDVEPLRQELVRARYLLWQEREWRVNDRPGPAPDRRS